MGSQKFNYVLHLFAGNIHQHLAPRTEFSSGCPFSMASSQVALCGIILKFLPLQRMTFDFETCTCFLNTLGILPVCFDMSLSHKYFFSMVFSAHFCEYPFSYANSCLQTSSDVCCIFSGTCSRELFSYTIFFLNVFSLHRTSLHTHMFLGNCFLKT